MITLLSENLIYHLSSDVLTLNVHSKDESYEADPGDVSIEDAESVDMRIPEGIWVAGLPEKVIYSGSKITFEDLRVYDHKTLLKEKSDYSIKYLNNLNAGMAEIQIQGKGNYTKMLSVFFEIEKAPISDAAVESVSVMATGIVLTPNLKVVFNGKTLKKDKDYLITEKDGREIKEAGEYHLVISGINNFDGDAQALYTVGEKKENVFVSSLKIVQEYKSVEYDGSEKCPSVEVYEGKEKLVEGVHYVSDYENNVEVGTADIIVRGLDRYIGNKKTTFKITGTPLNKAVVLTVPKSVEYTGEEILFKAQEIVSKKLDDLHLEWIKISYLKNIDAGTATVILSGTGGYTGTIKKTFKIAPRTMESANVIVRDTVYAKKGAVTLVSVYDDETRLTEGKDYTLSYKDNKKVGIGYVTVKGKGNYKGTCDKVSFHIDRQDLGELSLMAQDVIATGKPKAHVCKIVINDLDGGALKAGSDYEKDLVYTYEEDTQVISNGHKIMRFAGAKVKENDIIPAGTMLRVTVTGCGAYYGQLSASYRVIDKKQDISKAKVKIADQVYSGEAVILEKEDISLALDGVSVSEDGFEIIGYTKNIAKGTATVTLKGIGAYGGLKTVSFKIVSKTISE